MVLFPSSHLEECSPMLKKASYFDLSCVTFFKLSGVAEPTNLPNIWPDMNQRKLQLISQILQL